MSWHDRFKAMKKKKRIWNKQELMIAYFIAKWDIDSLKMDEQEIVECVIGNTSVASLRMQTANFRFLLNIEGYQLEGYSKSMVAVIDDIGEFSKTQVLRIINEYADSRESFRELLKTKESNKKIEKRRIELNKQSEAIFKNKLAHLRKYRRLTKIK